MTENSLTCERCGMSIPAEAKVCPNCGAPAPGLEPTEAAEIKTEWTGPEEVIEQPAVVEEALPPEPSFAPTVKTPEKEPVYEPPEIPAAPVREYIPAEPAFPAASTIPPLPASKNRNLLYGIGGCCLLLVVLACVGGAVALVVMFF
ncbi:MAG: zinc-ribbon domain-containing protein [Anaerolineales bacterium]|nr:zinc-ribbon domain-containing protein [Anaerolineales bacterium]